jgi:Skp family chaperone for outer membrane proteins
MNVRLFSTALLVLTVLLATINSVAAQEQQQSGLVAVLDVAKVFQKHTLFNARMEQLKQEVDQFDVAMKKQADALRAEMEALKGQWEPGTENFKAGQADIARKDADMKIKANQKRQDVLDKEAQLYLQTYKEIQGLVQELATQYGITLVLRYDSSEIDPNDRPSVIKGVNRPVIFQRNLDLTNLVIPRVQTDQAKSVDATGTQR